MILKFVMWRLAVAAAFAAVIAHAGGAAAAAPGTDTPAATTQRATPAARVHSLRGTTLEQAGVAHPRAEQQGSRPSQAAGGSRADAPRRAEVAVHSQYGIVLEDGSFAGFANY